MIVKYEQYTGHQSQLICDGHFVVDLGLSKITIQTVSLQSVRNVLATGQFPFAEQHENVIVYPENACGSGIIFFEG